MEGIAQVDAFIILSRTLFAALGGFAGQIVGAVKHRIARIGLQRGGLQDQAQLHAGPHADGAPALDTIMPGDLGAAGQAHDVGDRQRQGI